MEVVPPAVTFPTVEKSFLVQKFAKLHFGQFGVIGYSVAGEETVVQVPEYGICFDIGRCPHFALTSEYVCVSHGHMDHVAALGYYISQRVFQGMSPGKLIVPIDIARPVEDMLRSWRQVERQNTPYELIVAEAGKDLSIRRDLLLRPIATHHGGGSLGYALVHVREKLKPELLGVPGPELAARRAAGEEIQYRLEVPLVTYLGDTTGQPGPYERNVQPVFTHPDVVNAQVLLTECTFYDAEHKTKAKHGKHLHVDQFAEIVPTIKCGAIVVLHVSRRTGIRHARKTLRKRLSQADADRVHFLMDFEDARSGGDVDDTAPHGMQKDG